MKDKLVYIRISEEEKKEMELSAKENGLDSVPAYLRWLHRMFVKRSP